MLLSFAFFAREDLGKYRAAMPCGRLLLDSGAFTAASIGKTIHLRQYAEFLERWGSSIDHAVTLDVIGDPVATARNTKWLHDRGHNVMPVFTRGGRTAEFDAMVRDSGYVCVGGGVGMPQDVIVRRLWALQRRAEELGGGIHALGVGNMPALRKIRPYSADASNVSSAFRYGTVITYDGRAFRTFPLSDRTRLRAHHTLLKAQGIEVAALAATGRQPTGTARDRLMQGMSMAYAAADEDTSGWGVPVPHSITDTPGTHLYSAVTGNHLAAPVAALDTLVHSRGWTVPLWSRYRTTHTRQCRAKRVAA